MLHRKQFTLLLTVGAFLLVFCTYAQAQLSRKPTPTREPRGAMGKRPDSAKNSLPRVSQKFKLFKPFKLFKLFNPSATFAGYSPKSGRPERWLM